MKVFVLDWNNREEYDDYSETWCDVFASKEAALNRICFMK